MLEIANSYNEPFKSEYVKAVDEFRLPFWDYFRPRGGRVVFPGIHGDEKTSFPYDYNLPRVLRDSNLMVNKAPDNKRDQISNPFCTFLFVDDKIPPSEWDYMDGNVCGSFFQRTSMLIQS